MSRPSLRITEIAETARRLERRIQERFPSSGLAGIAHDLSVLAEGAKERAEGLRRGSPVVAVTSGILSLGLAAILVYFVATNVRVDQIAAEARPFSRLEPVLGCTVLAGSAIIFLLRRNGAIRRARALDALHELRALAHIIDMHQLTKDPERIAGRGSDTPSSPSRAMGPFLLSRYLDYCSELLAIVSKVGAYYGDEIADAAALASVDQVEILTTGLSRKIWQKLMLLDRLYPGFRESEAD